MYITWHTHTYIHTGALSEQVWPFLSLVLFDNNNNNNDKSLWLALLVYPPPSLAALFLSLPQLISSCLCYQQQRLKVDSRERGGLRERRLQKNEREGRRERGNASTRKYGRYKCHIEYFVIFSLNCSCSLKIPCNQNKGRGISVFVNNTNAETYPISNRSVCFCHH